MNVNDVEEHCITDPVNFVEQFVKLDGSDTEYGHAMTRWGDDPANGNTPAEELAFNVSVFAPFGLGLDVASGDGEMAKAAMNQTFIMAFADIATAEPIDPLGNFDPATGEGSVDVPDIAPGHHPIVAACVGLPDEIPDELYYPAMEAMVAYIEANYPEPHPPEFSDFLGDEFAEMASDVFPVLLRELVEIKALDIATPLYCVDDGTGSCDDEEIPDPTDPQTPPGDPQTPPGEGGEGGPGGGSQAPGAKPVTGRPSYTG